MHMIRAFAAVTVVMAVAGLACAAVMEAKGASQTKPGDDASYHFCLPGRAWALEAPIRDLKVTDSKLAPDGTARRMQGESKDANIIISIFLEEIPELKDKTNKGVRDYYWSPGRSGPLPKSATLSDVGPFTTVENFIGEPGGFGQDSINGYLYRDGVCIDVHISRVTEKVDEKPRLKDVLSSIKVDENYEPSVSELLYFGLVFAKADNRKNAALYLQKALDKEKEKPQLPKEGIRLIVDQLGVSYGMMGDYKKSAEVLNYGISIEPTFPRFHYNLACTLAESGDIDKAIGELRLANKYKANYPRGTKMADPRTDPSFAKYIKDEKFLKALKEMGL